MYKSYKRFIGYSTAFRQWRADSHCKLIHGYKFCYWFEGELDDNGWVIDFGCFKRNGVKEWLKNMFDHTTCVNVNDLRFLHKSWNHRFTNIREWCSEKFFELVNIYKTLYKEKQMEFLSKVKTRR